MEVKYEIVGAEIPVSCLSAANLPPPPRLLSSSITQSTWTLDFVFKRDEDLLFLSEYELFSNIYLSESG